jgi:hypothetical protein
VGASPRPRPHSAAAGPQGPQPWGQGVANAAVARSSKSLPDQPGAVNLPLHAIGIAHDAASAPFEPAHMPTSSPANPKCRCDHRSGTTRSQLTFTFPEDATTSTGAPFWSAPKRFPRALSFDPADPAHTGFVQVGGDATR